MAFRLLYPEPDSVTVVGSNNATYWFMLLVRVDALTSFRPLYILAVGIEIVALVIGFTLHIRGFVIFWRVRAIHINFLLLAAEMYAVMIIGSIARLLTIPYEMRIDNFSSLYEPPIPFFAMVRQATYVHIFHVLCVYTIERTCATLYVVDYEKYRRLHISLVLNVLITIFSYATGYAVVTGVLNAFIVTSVALLTNLACGLWFHWLVRYNKQRLSRLTHHVSRQLDAYSLSLRVQLKENIWSMKASRSKIELGVYLLIAGIASNMALVFLPIFLLSSPTQFEALQWLTCAGNLAYALSILCTAPWLEVAMAIHTSRVPPILRAILGSKYFKKAVPTRSSEIDSHFNQLDSQWKNGLSTRKSSHFGSLEFSHK